MDSHLENRFNIYLNQCRFRPLGANVNTSFCVGNAFENVVCKVSSSLLKSQCIKINKDTGTAVCNLRGKQLQEGLPIKWHACLYLWECFKCHVDTKNCSYSFWYRTDFKHIMYFFSQYLRFNIFIHIMSISIVRCIHRQILNAQRNWLQWRHMSVIACQLESM